MNEISVHYGDMLTEKIRESTTDFSKISDFDKFVLNNGYKFATKEELQAGYDRHWKASRNILVTMEEFLAEAGKKKSDPAAATYEALVGLVKENKLRPGEVLGYAHFHWCLNSPEAVIAYQTGPKEWAVNNCGAEITVEQAQVEICEESRMNWKVMQRKFTVQHLFPQRSNVSQAVSIACSWQICNYQAWTNWNWFAF